MEKLSFRDLFKKALQDKFGSTENLDFLEEKLKPLREGKPITYKDLKAIEDESIWPFKKFWTWPPEEEISKDLEKTGELLRKISENREQEEESVIISLNQIFRNISLVSIILRFIFPEYYGIYSSPVLHITGVERGKTDVEEYTNYLKVLRQIKDMVEIRERYQVERVADADMLLLAVAELGDEYTDEFNHIYWRASHPKETYLIELTSDFFESTDKHDKATKARIFEAIYNLSRNPTALIGNTTKKLEGFQYDFWRYRLGDFRLIYLPDNLRRVVKFVFFGKREDVYKKIERKFKK